MLFICYPKCGTCRKARKYLEEHGIPFQERLIHEEPPTVKELRTWQKKRMPAAAEVLQHERKAVQGAESQRQAQNDERRRDV